MTPVGTQPLSRDAWTLADRQHAVVTRRQLLGLGLTADAIKHRLANGRLHRVAREVYAVGRPGLTRRGRWMAAVLTCGPDAALSHESAAALWGIRDREGRGIDVSVPARRDPRRRGVVVHRRVEPPATVHHRGIPVTTPISTLVDLATRLDAGQLEAAVNEADKRGLTDPEALRRELARLGPLPVSPACAERSTAAPSRSPTPSSSVAGWRSPERPAFPSPTPGPA